MKRRTYEDPAREMKRKTRKRRRHEERAGARIDVVFVLFCFLTFRCSHEPERFTDGVLTWNPLVLLSQCG